MNDDTSKPEIGAAQTYFAIQTRRMEVQEALTEEERRLQLRNRVRDRNKKLNSAAKSAGVVRYPLFHDAGYRGLYGGKGLKDVKRYKGIPAKDEFLDRIGRVELAANEFRITQTEQKIIQEKILGEENAMHAC